MTTEQKPGAFPPRVKIALKPGLSTPWWADVKWALTQFNPLDFSGDGEVEYMPTAEHLHLTSALEEGVKELQDALIKVDGIIAVAYVKNWDDEHLRKLIYDVPVIVRSAIRFTPSNEDTLQRAGDE